jgi:trans-aconitate 2-methyltransferase
MLDRARNHAGIDWVLGDIDAWSPPSEIDLIFSNAALHWVGDHGALFPRLAAHLSPGGVLAVQMPHNHRAPSHQMLYELARSPQWSDRVEHLVVESPVADPEWYHELLAPSFGNLDVWDTVHQQPLTGVDPVAEWTKGSVMRPYLAQLGDDADAFCAEYAERLRPHYPTRSDGITLFGFRRLFIVGVR